MQWQYTPYTIPLLVAAGVSVVLAGYVLNRARYRQHERGLLAFTVCLLAAGIWSAAMAGQVVSVGLEAKFLWRVVGYVGHNLIPISLFVFAVHYTGNHRHLTRRTLAALAVVPLSSALVIAPTNPLHHLMWSDVGLVDAGAYVLLDPSFGPLYWVTTAYNYVLVVSALLLFVQLAVRAGGGAHSRQVAVFLVGLSLPFVANVAWTAGLTPVDVTPIAFAVMGVAFMIDIVHFRFLDVLPVARGAVIEELTDGYIVVDGDGRVADTNPTSDRLIEHPDPIGEPAATVLPTAIRDALDANEPLDAADELVAPGPGGDRRYEIQVSPLTDSGSAGTLVLLRDVTERRAVEDRYRRLIENASDVVVTLDFAGQVSYVSPSVTRVLGYDPDHFDGDERSVEYIHPDDRERAWAAFQELASEPGASGSLEHRFRHADGSWIWMESRVRNLAHDPAIGGMIINARDITERKRREHDLERQNERLEEFTGVVSHDLRNPLAVIRGYADLARDTGDEQYLGGIETAVDRMDRLIEDLLQLARHGREIESTEPVHLEEAVRAAWQHVETGDATLAVDGDLGTIRADRDRLTQLLENLFRNSVEHGAKRPAVAVETDAEGSDAGPDGASTAVTITVGRSGDEFWVADDGPGIPAANRERVFERGFTTNDRGTGFGLSIVRTIADAHGWSIRADGSDGGARFVVSDVE